jgi:hypothetical protein
LETSKLIDASFAVQKSKNILLGKIKWISGISLVVSFGGSVAWEYSEWSYFFLRGAPNATLWSNDILAPIPFKIFTWQYIITTSLFRLFPFALSQQVYLCAVILAIILFNVLESLGHEICDETALYKHAENQEVEGVQMEKTKSKLKKWEYIHFYAGLLYEGINNMFGLVFLMTYLLDSLIMLGFGSWLISYTTDTLSEYAFSIGSFILFGVYATVFPIPMVRVYEKVKSIDTSSLKASRYTV